MQSACPKLNTIVDRESKHCHDSSNWELCLSVLKVLNHLLVPFSIDLFASRIMQSSIASWKPDPGALALTVDGFPSHGLGKSLTYFLLCLISRAWLKVHREAVNHAC